MKKEKQGLSLLGSNSTKYPTSPEDAVLEVFANPSKKNKYEIEFQTSEFTSLCPITSQPDFAAIRIKYTPNKKCIESKSLKLYLFSFRNVGGFAEDIVNRILKDVVKACEPENALVTGEFTARGGLTIKVSSDYNSET